MNFLSDECCLNTPPAPNAVTAPTTWPEPRRPATLATDLWPADEPLVPAQRWHQRKQVRLGTICMTVLLLGAFVIGRATSNNIAANAVTKSPVTPAASDRSERPSELVVCANGGGQFRSVLDAVQKAAPGSVIRVKPGHYRGGVALDKKLEIVGDGPRDQIVLESIGYACVDMQTDEARVRGLTLRTRSGDFGKDFHAVNLTQGRLLLEDCDISSDSISCIAISGSETNPVIRQCVIHGGKDAGVFVSKAGKGTFEDCEIHNHATSGVSIRGGSAPTLRRCRIHNCRRAGVLAFDKGAGELEDCHIYGNDGDGVEVSQESNPVLRKCHLHSGKGAGVSVREKGKGTLENCVIHGNGRSGVAVWTGGDPVLRQCEIRDGNDAGVYVYRGGLGRFENCHISNHAAAEVAIKTAGNPVFEGCHLIKGRKHGLWVLEKGQGTLINCQIMDNAAEGVVVNRADNTTLRNCRILRNGSRGVGVHDNSKVTIQDCELSDNKNGPGFVQDGCTVAQANNSPPLPRPLDLP